jgi:hypothetical protein
MVRVGNQVRRDFNASIGDLGALAFLEAVVKEGRFFILTGQLAAHKAHYSVSQSQITSSSHWLCSPQSMLPHSLFVAFSAVSVLSVKIGVRGGVFVTAGTVTSCAELTSSTVAVSRKEILGRRGQSQMTNVNANLSIAEMVDLHSFRNRTMFEFISDAMRGYILSV